MSQKTIFKVLQTGVEPTGLNPEKAKETVTPDETTKPVVARRINPSNRISNRPCYL